VRIRLLPFLPVSLTLAAGCGGPGGASGGTATVMVADKSFESGNVTFAFEAGDDGYFRIEGDDGADPHRDCLPGLGGGLALYGDLPSDVTSIADLAGRELPFEFSGDGDDFNLCFVGTDGLLGVDRGTVRFTAADETKVTFSFSGTFTLYDGRGEKETPGVTASGGGVAHVGTEEQ
jgi:hypothetical protein